MMDQKSFVWILLALFVLGGCAAAVVGGGAAGSYKAATDERTVGTMIDDTTLSTRVKAKLMDDFVVPAMQVDVDVQGGRVTLTGVVDNREQYERAAAVAGRVQGVRSVRNLLQVGQLSIGESVDDAVIATRIKAKLMGAKGIRSWNIDVDSDKGMVTLTGLIPDDGQRYQIVSMARSVKGVRHVIDNLRVK